MRTLTPRSFPNLAQCDALSKNTLGAHIRLYEGYVNSYNKLMAKRQTHLSHGPATSASELDSLKVDITYALGAIKNHELFFDLLGPESDGPTGPLTDALVKSFHSVPQFLIDLKQSALLGRNWVFTAYDLDNDYLFNYESGAQNGLPVWNAVPILALDLYGHAYFYDFGTNRLAYIEAIMKCLDWTKIAARLAAAQAGTAHAVSKAI